MSRFVLVLAFVAAVGVLRADPVNPTTTTPDDPIYQSVRRLALRAGQSPPSAIAPISYGENEVGRSLPPVDDVDAARTTPSGPCSTLFGSSATIM